MKRKRRGIKGVGIGAHQQVSAMGHATRTKSKRERRLQLDRKIKRRGVWE